MARVSTLRAHDPLVDGDIRYEFERLCLDEFHVPTSRAEPGYYLMAYTEYMFMGFCAAKGVDYMTVN